MRAFVTCLLPCALISTAIAPTAFGQIMVVLAGESWSTGGKILNRAAKIPMNGPISAAAEGSSDLVLDCGNKGWIEYACKKLPCRVLACSQTVSTDNVAAKRVSPTMRGQDGSSESQGGLFASLFRRQPAALAVLGVRDVGHPNDAVVLRSGIEIHLGPALHRVLEGKYCFRFTALPAGTAAPLLLTLDWDRSIDKEGILQAPNLQPGLYSLEKSPTVAAGQCKFEEEETPAWVLVSPAAQFAKIEPAWEDYSNQILQTERSGASPAAALTIRHAVLASLADSEGK